MPGYRRENVRLSEASGYRRLWPVGVRGRLVLGALAALTTLSGCSLFLPSHSNSNHREGEKVTIQLIAGGDLTPEEKEDYQAVFPPKRQGVLMDPVSAAAAAALVGFAIDYVADELEEESSLYEAQFGETVISEQFWNTEESRQNYVGFRLIREVKAGILDEDDQTDGLEADDGLVEAFRLVCGFAPSEKGLLFRVAPLQFRTRLSKAKVLSDELWWWFLPTAWLGKLLKHDEHEIDTVVEVEMDAYWRGGGKQPKLNITRVAGFSLEFKSYDLSQQKLWRASDRGTLLPKGPKAFFLGVPVSRDEHGTFTGSGAFMLKALVTERDKSNASQYLKKLSKLVADQKGKVVEKIENSGDN